MNFWRVLGIEPTNNIKKIKAAYAQKAKDNHPEEYPEAFKQLQAAYKMALNYAKSQSARAEKLTWHQEPKEDINLKDIQPEDIQFKSIQPKDIKIGNIKFDNKKNDDIKIDDIKTDDTKIDDVKTDNIQIDNPPLIKVTLAAENMESYYDFSYDGLVTEIVDKQNEETRFWRELKYLLWHPHARQSYKVWECFLEQPKYKQLFQDGLFREQFINMLSVERFEWIHFFGFKKDKYKNADWFIARYVNSFNAGKLPEIEKRIYDRIHEGCMPISSLCNEKEGEIYDSLWRWEEEKYINVEEYLNRYFQYAQENEYKLQAIHLQSNAERPRMNKQYKKKHRDAVFCGILMIPTIPLLIYSIIMWWSTK